jgi:hypothetical protein
MKKTKISVAFLFVVVLIASCKKDDETPSATAMLTAKTWTITKVETKANGATTDVTDDFSSDPCENDDTILFKSGGVYEENPGADDCNGDDVLTTGTWALKNADKTLSITTDGDTEDWTINSLTSTKAVIESIQFTADFDDDGDEESGSLIFTFTAK